jgi:hypothetical protein
LEIKQPQPIGVSTLIVAKPSGEERGAKALLVPGAAIEVEDIRPLDGNAMLRILIAELQLGLEQLLGPNAVRDSAPDLAATANLPLEDRAARVLVGAFLQALPVDLHESSQDGDVERAMARAEAVLQASAARAIDIIARWRETPAAIPILLREALTQALVVLRDEFGLPILMRPEWLGLGPQLERLRRLRARRRARRRQTGHEPGCSDSPSSQDPDYLPSLPPKR